MKLKPKNRITILLFALSTLIISLFARNSSYQQSYVEYFNDISVVEIHNLTGMIQLRNAESSTEVEMKALAFFDAGELEKSRKLIEGTSLKVYKKNDTMMVFSILPVDKIDKIHMRELRNPFTKKYNVEYQNKNIMITPRSGIEHFIDFTLSVPESVEVRCLCPTAKIELEAIDFNTRFEGEFFEFSGNIDENGSMDIISDKSKGELKNIFGKFHIKSKENNSISLKGNLSGNIDIEIGNGEVFIENIVAPKVLSVNQKAGRFVFSGNCPDSSFILFNDVTAQFDLIESGKMKIISKAGNIELFSRVNTFDYLDIAVQREEVEYKLPKTYKIEGNGKNFIAKKDNFGDNRLLIRSSETEIEIEVFE
ncbi:MAG: hypothetical protein ACLFSQ_06845 [Candidatus Zixiibacteriota bacterium]